MKKIKLVISDFHISKGRILEDGSANLLEDFLYDVEFIDFLKYYSEGDYRKADVELIVNGDFLNTLQVDYREQYPTYITEAIALEKLTAIIAGHPDLFNALKEFLEVPGHSLTYLPANHDPAFLWPDVRVAFGEFLEAEVKYVMKPYTFDGIHVEHGNRYSVMNAFEENKYFLHEGLPEPILNLPWGSLFIIGYLNRIKLKRGFVDKVRPLGRYLRWSLVNDPLFGWPALIRLVIFIITTRFIPSKLREAPLKKTWEMIKEGFRLVPDLETPARKILKRPDFHTVIMGHTHKRVHRVYQSDKQYINVGTWNEMIHLDIENLGRERRLTFALIEYPDKGRPGVSLMEWKGIHQPVRKLDY